MGFIYFLFFFILKDSSLELAVCKKFDKANSDRIKITVKLLLLLHKV